MSIETLKQLGLSDNETKVYLAALELGQATVQELGKKSGVKRTTVYTAIDGLKEKGIISQIKKGAKTFLMAESPEVLGQIADRRAQMLKESLPELKSIYNIAGVKPKVRFFEGQEGYLAVYENILKEKPKELLGIASYENFKKHIDDQFEEIWTAKRIKQGVFLRWLDFKTPSVQARVDEGEKGLREVRFLPKEFSFSATMFIYNEKVIMVSGKQKEFLAVVIENAEFSQMQKQVFEMLWASNK